ncbi:MAG: hypothetical protein N3B01_10130, partial [Verrucomicrobiae bacterium]|nr:hypothetical protein [Verrucomicrobiae bacterium]
MKKIFAFCRSRCPFPSALVRWGLLLAVLLCVGATRTPQVSNRPPRPDEWGYRPADGETVRLNPPSLTWVHEREAVSYTVQL